MKIIDWMKKGKQDAVKIKVSDFNNTSDPEDVTIVGDDLVIEGTHTIADEHLDPTARKTEDDNNLNIEQSSANSDVINWMHENSINNWSEELSEHDILQKISQEFCVNNEFLNKLGTEIANNLAEMLSTSSQITEVNTTEYSKQIRDFISLITPQLEKELKLFKVKEQNVQK